MGPGHAPALVAPLLALTLGMLASTGDPATSTPEGAPPARPPVSAATPGQVQAEKLTEGWYARIETSMGPIVARLLPQQAPQAVAHFAALAEGKLPWPDVVTGDTRTGHYYDGVRVHRVETARLFELGDHADHGVSAPRFWIPPGEGAGPVDFSRPYRLGMTGYGGGRISGVVFFVTVSAQPWFDGKYPCFGEVVQGHDVAWNVASVKVYDNKRPVEPVTVKTIRVFSVGAPAPLPDPKSYQPAPAGAEFRAPRRR